MTYWRSPRLLSPATRSRVGVGKVEHGSAVRPSVFAGSAAHVAVATISRRLPDGAVGNAAAPDSDGNGPKVATAGHTGTGRGPFVPSDFHLEVFQGGGSGWVDGQSTHHTCTVT